MQENHYTTLGIDEAATAADIKRAYKELVQVWHPDRFGDNDALLERASRQMIRVNEAHEVLCDPESRRRYDEQLRRDRQRNPDPLHGERIRLESEIDELRAVAEAATLRANEIEAEGIRRGVLVRDFVLRACARCGDDMEVPSAHAYADGLVCTDCHAA